MPKIYIWMNERWHIDYMNKVKPFYYIGTTISLLFGIWHFFVPYLYDWFLYIPAYENLVVGIEYTNFFFSLLLSGLSILLVVLGGRFFQGNKDVMIFYGLMVFTWFCRTIITFIKFLHPEKTSQTKHFHTMQKAQRICDVRRAF